MSIKPEPRITGQGKCYLVLPGNVSGRNYPLGGLSASHSFINLHIDHQGKVNKGFEDEGQLFYQPWGMFLKKTPSMGLSVCRCVVQAVSAALMWVFVRAGPISVSECRFAFWYPKRDRVHQQREQQPFVKTLIFLHYRELLMTLQFPCDTIL